MCFSKSLGGLSLLSVALFCVTTMAVMSESRSRPFILTALTIQQILNKMAWQQTPNNTHLPTPLHDESLRTFSLLQQTPNNIPLPSPFVQFRGRLNSVTSSFLSPMRHVTSPNMNDADNLFEFQLRPADKERLEKFSLDGGGQAEPQPIQEDQEQPRGDDSSEQPNQQPEVASSESLTQIIELIRAVTQNLGIDDTELERQRRKYSEMQDQQYVMVFDMLARKLRKVKKTKQEMIKYCMRKVFRYLSERVRGELSSGPRDNSECLKYYFGKYENDKTFNVPFKKNSVEKTMNSNFLAKVFSCPLFVEDYRKYMKMFRSHAEKDNSKKIDALAKVIFKGIETRNMRVPFQNIQKIDTFKRLPWTQLIINRSEELARSLLEYSKVIPPTATEVEERQSPQQVLMHEKREEEELREHRHEIKHVKKGSIILLTPPMGPLSSPHIEDKKLEQILKL